MKFSRGHVGSLIKYFRSPQENLRAHNEIELIFLNSPDAKYYLSTDFLAYCTRNVTLSTFLLSILYYNVN